MNTYTLYIVLNNYILGYVTTLLLNTVLTGLNFSAQLQTDISFNRDQPHYFFFVGSDYNLKIGNTTSASLTKRQKCRLLNQASWINKPLFKNSIL